MKENRKYLPFRRKKVELFSRINEIRVAKGLTMPQLCKLSGVPSSTLTAYCNGTLSPLRQNSSNTKKVSVGDWKPQVIRIAEVLDVPVEEMFPDHISNQEKILTESQLISMSMCMIGGISVEDTVIARDFLFKLSEMAEENLSPLDKDIFFGIMLGKSQEEIGIEKGVTRADISQKYVRIRKHLKKVWNTRQILLEQKVSHFEISELRLR